MRVPFRGGGEAVAALLTGVTPVGHYGIANVRSQLEVGSVRGLAVDSDARSPLFPDIPTFLGGIGPEIRRQVLFRPGGACGHARTIVDRLHAAVARIVAEPEFRRKNLIERGLVPVVSSPAEFGRFISEDRVTAEQIVTDAGLQPQ